MVAVKSAQKRALSRKIARVRSSRLLSVSNVCVRCVVHGKWQTRRTRCLRREMTTSTTTANPALNTHARKRDLLCVCVWVFGYTCKLLCCVCTHSRRFRGERQRHFSGRDPESRACRAHSTFPTRSEHATHSIPLHRRDRLRGVRRRRIDDNATRNACVVSVSAASQGG